MKSQQHRQDGQGDTCAAPRGLAEVLPEDCDRGTSGFLHLTWQVPMTQRTNELA